MENREQMNIAIVGHVDHGKSTVIGRLLADTGSLPEGKLEAVKEYCRKNARPFEYAFLLDALKDEQAQGITIDTARCFFKTQKRNYIINDAPGHIEFLKNMVTGASRAEAVLLVIDAKEGIQENSKRHGHIVSMLGIHQVVVLVNKMDLVDFDQDVFDSIKKDFSSFLNKNKIDPINFIPISAFNGDNIAAKSTQIRWYDGPTVLEQLDGFKNKEDDEDRPFRMSVQDIYKFTAEGDDRRIVAGTVLSGKIRTGDEVVFLPSKKRSVIKTIEGFNISPKNIASADEAIGVTLDTQIYIKPGELMVKADEKQALVGSQFRANIFWVGKAPLIKDKIYKLKTGTMKIGVRLVEILNIIDAAELNIDTFKDQVERHDVAECVFEAVKPITFDPISDMEYTARFVIVDTYEISGGGIVLENVSETADQLEQRLEEEQFVWERGFISPSQREEVFGHRGKFVVITSGSEDSQKKIQEIGKDLELKLFSRKISAYYLGIPDSIQGGVLDVTLSYEKRDAYIRQITETGKMFSEAGHIFITTVFNLEDDEAMKIEQLNYRQDVIFISIGERSLNKIQPDADLNEDKAVDEIYSLLKGKDLTRVSCLRQAK